MKGHVAVVGAGVFGVTAAGELARRGYRVTLFDAGQIPNPLAASTDISKVVRMEYGVDHVYMALGEAACAGWRAWNAAWARRGLEPLYHESGVLMICRSAMRPGGFEHDSYRTLLDRGHSPERLDAAEITRRYPAWKPGSYVDGFFHAEGGYVESGAVVTRLVQEARELGVEVCAGERIVGVEPNGVPGVRTEGGESVQADRVVVAAGCWTSTLLPELARCVRATGHAVFHLRPTDPDLFRTPGFPTFTADVAETGYYGFPLGRSGVVKIGVHSLGTPLDPDGPRRLPDGAEASLRAFLSASFPSLSDAPIVFRRLCPYADTPEEDFWIDRAPERPWLTVASGGSGHGFKFAPVLGPIIADTVENRTHPYRDKFRWRVSEASFEGREAARCRTAVGAGDRDRPG